LPVLAADTDEQAGHLATSTQQRGLRLIRGQPIFTPPPVASMDGLWNTGEKRAVEGRLAAAVIGSLRRSRLPSLMPPVTRRPPIRIGINAVLPSEILRRFDS